jgi:hypothetical protein
MKRAWVLAALPLIAAAPPPMDAETRSDVRCFTALAILTADAKEEDIMNLTIVSQYYLGRIDGRSPGLDLESALAAEAESMGENEIRQLVKSCAVRVQERGRQLQSFGEGMQERQPDSSSSSSS